MMTFLVLISTKSPVQAQSTFKLCSKPIKITHTGKYAYTPFVVSDKNDTLYAVWSENFSEVQAYDLNLDTIYFAQKIDSAWSDPIDIFASSENGQARVNRLRIDSRGNLHLVYTEWPGIVYAKTSITTAGNPRDWQSTHIAENAWMADIAIGADNVVHMVYILDRKGVFYISSEDGGQTWSSPITIWDASSSAPESSNSVRIEVDNKGILHVAWDITAATENQWTPIGIAYARSVDGGITWKNDFSFSGKDDYPSIGFDLQGRIHLVWDNTTASMLGRGYTMSTDGGRTWFSPERIFPGFRGTTRWPAMTLDSAGTLHLFTSADSQVASGTRIFHSQWENSKWSEPELVSGNLIAVEGPSVAVSNGNHLDLMAFSWAEKEYGIWYVECQTSAPEIKQQNFLTRSTPPSIKPIEIKSTQILPQKDNQTINNGSATPISFQQTIISPILLASFVVILVVICIVMVRTFLLRR